MKQNTSLSFPHFLLVISVVVIWGINFVVTKVILQHFPVFQTLSLRFLLLMLCCLPLYPKPPVPWATLMKIVVVFAVGHLGCMFGSMAVGLDASLAVVIQQLAIPFMLLLSVLFLKEHIGWKSITGIVVAIVGTVILAGAPNSTSQPLGVFLILCSAFFWAVYSFQLKKLQDQVNPVAMVSWIGIGSLVIMIPLAVFVEDGFWHNIVTAGWVEWSIVGYQAILGSAVSHGAWCYLVSKNPMNTIAPFILLVPVSGAIAAVLFLGEPLTIQLIGGGALMLIGVGVITVRRPRVSKIAES